MKDELGCVLIKKWRWWRRWRRKPILTPVTPEPHRLNFKRSSAVGEIQLRVRSIFSREVLMNTPPTGKHPWMGAVDGCEAACQSPAPPKKPLINKTLPVFSFSSLSFLSAVKTSNGGALHLNCSCFMTNSFSDLEVIKALRRATHPIFPPPLTPLPLLKNASTTAQTSLRSICSDIRRRR